MHIKNSLEWSSVESSLTRRTIGLSRGIELRKLILNIRPSVTELSKAEVDSRQGRHYRADTILAAINADIDMVEEYILVAVLVG